MEAKIKGGKGRKNRDRDQRKEARNEQRKEGREEG